MQRENAMPSEERVMAMPGYLVVKDLKEGEQKTVGGLVLPQNARDAGTVRVTVLHYGGPGPDEPDLKKCGLAKGHTGVVSTYAGNVVKVNQGEELRIIRQQDLLGLVGTE